MVDRERPSCTKQQRKKWKPWVLRRGTTLQWFHVTEWHCQWPITPREPPKGLWKWNYLESSTLEKLELDISQLPFASLSKWVYVQQYSEKCVSPIILYCGEEYREVKLANFPPYYELFCTIVIFPYSHTNSYNNAVTQCHVDGSQRSLDYLWFSIAIPRGVIWLLLMRSFA